jgi:nucleotide-binding universal stress UspA family protein
MRPERIRSRPPEAAAMTMVTIHGILVATNFSVASARALEFGRTLASLCSATLHVLHVVPHPFLGEQQPARTVPELEIDLVEKGCRELETLVEPDKAAMPGIVTRCTVGTPAIEIVRYAADNAIDLIIMGTHSHGPTFQMFTGSIAEQVVRMAPCPVMTVKSAPGPAGMEEPDWADMGVNDVCASSRARR